MTCDDRCLGCPLDGKAQPFDLDTTQDARFLVVLDTPKPEVAAQGRMLPAPAMAVFKRVMQRERFENKDFAFVPAIRCPHDPDQFTAKEKRAIAAHCRGYLLDDIKQVRPDVILPMGATAASLVIGRPVKINKVRGIVEYAPEHRSLILPTISPTQVAYYPQHESSFAGDCATLGRLVDHNYNIMAASQSAMGDYVYVDDLEFLVKEAPERIAYDTEGSGLVMTDTGSDFLRWYAPNAKLLTMQFCIEPGKAYMLPWDHPDSPIKNDRRQKERLKQQFIKLMCRPGTTIVGHHLKFDVLMTLRHLGVRLKIGSDSLMLAALIDENSYTKNLDDTIKRWVPAMAGYADRFNNTVDKGHMDQHPLDEEFLDYGAGDADAAFRLEDVLYNMVAEDPKLLNHYNYVSIPTLNAFASMETRGMHIAEDEIDQFEEFMQDKVRESYDKLIKLVPRSIRRKHVEKGLKFSRPDFVRDILFEHPDGFRLKPRLFTKGTAKFEDPSRRVASTSSKQHLPYYFEECPFTIDLAQYMKDESLLSKNVVGFRNKYVVDGMVRPQYGLARAVTGRTNSEDPNGQNFPKRGKEVKAYRKMFRAPDGYYYIEGDESQAELRIAADMANEPTMIGVYRTGGDIHLETALIVKRMTKEVFERLGADEKDLARFRAKAVNFGFLYGMWWKKFVVYAKVEYGVTFTDREAEQIRLDFFEKYYKLQEFHEKIKAYARKNKQVRSYSGRIRHLPMIDSPEDWIRQEAERQAINSPIQEFASSLGLMALWRLEEEIDDAFLMLVSFVHDALYAYVPCQYLEWGAKTMKLYMETNPIEEWFGIKLKVPLIADVKFGLNLGEMYELKGLQLDPPTLRGRAASRYDFSQFWDEEKQKGIIVPAQSVPPNSGRRLVSPYTEYTEAA